MNDEKLQLSPEGEKRRSKILDLAQESAANRIKFRRAVRTGLATGTACVAIAILIVGIVFQGIEHGDVEIANRPDMPETEKSEVEIVASEIKSFDNLDNEPESKYQFIDFEVIQPDANILERYVVSPLSHSSRVVVFEILDDDQLVAEIVEHDLPYGLAKVGEEVMLLGHEDQKIH